MSIHDPQLNPTVSAVLREQAAAIYAAWIAGNEATASAMLRAVPHERTAYVVFTLAVLAVNEGPHTQFAMSRFMEGVTQ